MKYDENDLIVLRPSFAYWMAKNILPLLFAASLLFLLKPLAFVPFSRFFLPLISLLLFGNSFFKYVDILLCTKWEITAEQLKIYEGVFSKSVNYIELYRIFDYEEKKNFIEAILNISTVFVHSGDKTNPILPIFGIRNGGNIIDVLRSRVESMKKIKSIHEFTNR